MPIKRVSKPAAVPLVSAATRALAVLERLSRQRTIGLEDLPAELRGQATPGANGNGAPLEVGSLVSMEKLEEAHLRRILQRTSNLAEAADVLGIDQATLYRKRKKIGLE